MNIGVCETLSEAAKGYIFPFRGRLSLNEKRSGTKLSFGSHLASLRTDAFRMPLRGNIYPLAASLRVSQTPIE